MKKSNIVLLLSFVPILFLAGCEEAHEDKVNRLVSFIEENEISGTDYFIEQKTLEEWAKVGLIFGMVDDYGLCMDIVNSLNRDPSDTFRCTPAN